VRQALQNCKATQYVQRATFTVAEAQAFSGVGRNTLLKLIADKKIQAKRIGKRRWLIMRDSLERWLRGES